MDAFLSRIRDHLDKNARRLLPLFETMAGEAKFARDWLNDDLTQLPGGASLLEVGGGVFILSCALAAEGVAITAIEPTGEGFGEFEELAAIVLELAEAKPLIVRCKAEYFTSAEKFDYAFSLNVMEHIERPDIAISRISAVLKPGASYRFQCPNYLFPYEPHFNIPTFGSKRLTEKLMRRRIFEHPRMDDPAGLWQSLNWISVGQVRRFVVRDPSLMVTFNRHTLVWILERAMTDEGFAARRAGWMLRVIRLMTALRLHRLAGVIPASLQPIMDVRLTKRI